MRMLIIICGPTATGKTKLALRLAKKLAGEIVSADSRQVYKEFDIGTGKDIPPSAKFTKSNLEYTNGYYNIGSVKLWGYDLASPNEDFSVSNYKKAAEEIIYNIYSRDKMPIMVGGTGLYIKAITQQLETINIPKNAKLRKSLDNKSASELFEILAVENPIKAASLNSSDKKNPRRLIRAIEVEKSNKVKTNIDNSKIQFDKVLKIGLTADKEILHQRIKNRVAKRINNGFEKEFALLTKKYKLDSQAFSSLGYRQWSEYYKSKISKDEAIKLWTKEEQKYAKRQITWFKKDKEIIWHDITNSKFPENVEKLVTEWYTININYAEKN